LNALHGPSRSSSPWAFQDLQGGHRKNFSNVLTRMTLGADYNIFSIPVNFPSDDVVLVKGQTDASNAGGPFVPTPGHPAVLDANQADAKSVLNITNDIDVFELVNHYTTCVADVGFGGNGFFFPYKPPPTDAAALVAKKPSVVSR